MLEKALSETDPESTDVVVMTAKTLAPGETAASTLDLDAYDQHLMTAVVEHAERAGKKVAPLIVPTNNPLHAVLKTATELHAQEVVLGASNKFTAEEQLDQIALYWIHLHEAPVPGLTVRILSRSRDVTFDLEGGNRIPKISERQAKSVAELRAAGVGVDRVLMIHDGGTRDTDLFQSVLTMLDPEVALDVVAVGANVEEASLRAETERARHVGREVHVYAPAQPTAEEIARLALAGQYDLLIVPGSDWTETLRRISHCPVLVAYAPRIPQEADVG